MPGFKLRFFNVLRNFIRILRVDIFLRRHTDGKGYSDLIVKCIPQNYQYPRYTRRKIIRDGIVFELDLSEYMEWVLYFGLNVEPREPLYSFVRPEMVIVDIGTNFGETLLQFARLVGEKGRAFGFEPVESSFLKCKQNISLNQFRNIRLEKMALSDREETLFFDSRTFNNSGGISMSKSKEHGNSRIQARRLDDFVRENRLPRIDFMKLDVEGFETNVLRGAREVCLVHHPELYIEVDDANLRRQGSSAAELLGLVQSYGYQIREKIVSPHAVDVDAHYDIHAVFK